MLRLVAPRCKCATPDTSRISHGYRKKPIPSPNSSLSGRTQKICGISAWLREQKDGLLSITFGMNEGASMSIIGWIILGLIAGFIASKIVDARGQGLMLNIVLVGTIVGGLVFNALG